MALHMRNRIMCMVKVLADPSHGPAFKEGQEGQEGGKEEAENGLVISCSGELNQTPVLKK